MASHCRHHGDEERAGGVWSARKSSRAFRTRSRPRSTTERLMCVWRPCPACTCVPTNVPRLQPTHYSLSHAMQPIVYSMPHSIQHAAYRTEHTQHAAPPLSPKSAKACCCIRGLLPHHHRQCSALPARTCNAASDAFSVVADALFVWHMLVPPAGMDQRA